MHFEDCVPATKDYKYGGPLKTIKSALGLPILEVCQLLATSHLPTNDSANTLAYYRPANTSTNTSAFRLGQCLNLLSDQRLNLPSNQHLSHHPSQLTQHHGNNVDSLLRWIIPTSCNVLAMGNPALFLLQRQIYFRQYDPFEFFFICNVSSVPYCDHDMLINCCIDVILHLP